MVLSQSAAAAKQVFQAAAQALILAALALVVLASAAWLLLMERDVNDPRVVIEVDGEIYCSYDMDEVKGIVPVSTPNGGENRVWVQEDLVFMDSANCPDQICVKQGVIRDGSVPIVCLPNKVIVRIEGGESGLDAAN